MAVNPIAVLSTVVTNATFADVELKLETIRLLDQINTELLEFEFSDAVEETAVGLRKLAYDADFEITEEDSDDTPIDDDDDEEVDFGVDDDED